MLNGVPDFIALARSFGVDGVHIREQDNLPNALDAALAWADVDRVHVRRGETAAMVPLARAMPRWLVLHPELAMGTTRNCSACGATTAHEHRLSRVRRFPDPLADCGGVVARGLQHRHQPLRFFRCAAVLCCRSAITTAPTPLSWLVHPFRPAKSLRP